MNISTLWKNETMRLIRRFALLPKAWLEPRDVLSEFFRLFSAIKKNFGYHVTLFTNPACSVFYAVSDSGCDTFAKAHHAAEIVLSSIL